MYLFAFLRYLLALMADRIRNSRDSFSVFIRLEGSDELLPLFARIRSLYVDNLYRDASSPCRLDSSSQGSPPACVGATES